VFARFDSKKQATALRELADKLDGHDELSKATRAAQGKVMATKSTLKVRKEALKEKKRAEKKALKGIKGGLKAKKAKVLGCRTWNISFGPILVFIVVGLLSADAFVRWEALDQQVWAPYVLGLLCGIAAGFVASAIGSLAMKFVQWLEKSS
jgi:hypothetical protein